MDRWEYKMLGLKPKSNEFDSKLYFEDTLNQYGAEGWEIVSVSEYPGLLGFWLKRKVEMRGNDEPLPAPPGPRCGCPEPRFFELGTTEAQPTEAWWRCLKCRRLVWMGRGPEPKSRPRF